MCIREGFRRRSLGRGASAVVAAMFAGISVTILGWIRIVETL
jgi:hypothetical protein